MSRCQKFNRKGARCLKASWPPFHLHVFEPVRHVGVRRAREMTDEAAFRIEVEARAGGLCEARFAVRPDGGFVCRGGTHEGEHAHHVLSRGRGGTHDPDNGLWVCAAAHVWIHDHPAAAEALGLLTSRWLIGDAEEAQGPVA